MHIVIMALSSFLKFIFRTWLDGKINGSYRFRGGGVLPFAIDWDELEFLSLLSGVLPPEPEALPNKSESLWAGQFEELSI